MNLNVVLIYVCILAIQSSPLSGCDPEPEFFTGNNQLSVEVRVATSEIVFRGLVASNAIVTSSRGQRGVFTTHFNLVNTYKGVETLSHFGSISGNFSVLNVSFTTKPSRFQCNQNSEIPLEYIIFGQSNGNDSITATSIVQWSENLDSRIWSALGWSNWSEWSPCSVSCSTGIQQRTRHCRHIPKCPGFNVEQRHCNLFGCNGSLDLLLFEGEGEFHTSNNFWQKVSDRPSAWRLTPASYIWVPSNQLQAKLQKPLFQQFALFVTLRISHLDQTGTIFSVRSRSQDTYLSLETTGYDMRLIHASKNGTDLVRIPVKLNDSHWHQVSISVRENSIVDIYIDCEWTKTEIFRRNTLGLPQDSDLVIGYLFTGDLEQLTIHSNPRLSNLQCSSNRTPIFDSFMSSVENEID